MRQARFALFLGLCGLIAGCDDAPRIKHPIAWQERIVLTRGNEFYPNTVVVPRGEHVRLTFHSTDGEPHSVRLEAYGKRSGLFDKKRDATLEFYAAHEGDFTYRCTVWNGMKHRGMSGRITVIDDQRE